MMKAMSAAILTTALGLTLAVSSWSQSPPSQAAGSQQSAAARPMDAMMTDCHQRYVSAIDATQKTIDEAKQSRDLVKIRSALEATQKLLDDIKSHMSGCMSMMNMDGMHEAK